MRILARLLLLLCVGLTVLPAAPAAAQPSPQPPMVIAPPLPPATMMEAFQYPINTLFTVGYEDLGEVAGISVEVREMRDARGGRVRGVVVEMTGAQSAREQSLIDADEIADLIKGFDALLEIRANPTQFKSFEIRYATRGELVLLASSSRNRGVVYSVEVGRLAKLQKRGLTGGEMHQLQVLFEAASQKLATLVADK
jgi:hypothetical protein